MANVQERHRFEGALRTSNQSIDISDVMRRLVKEDLLKFDGTPLFPERIAYTVNYDLSDAEAKLYTAVTSYVQDEFNRADHLDGQQRSTVGFALTILQRRLASSPEAIYQSLHRRRERLQNRLAEEKLGKRVMDIVADDQDDLDEMPGDELEQEEERVADQAFQSLFNRFPGPLHGIKICSLQPEIQVPPGPRGKKG